MKHKTIITGNCPKCGQAIQAATSPQHFGRNRAKHLREECQGDQPQTTAFSIATMRPRQLRRAGQILIKASRLVKKLEAL